MKRLHDGNPLDGIIHAISLTVSHKFRISPIKSLLLIWLKTTVFKPSLKRKTAHFVHFTSASNFFCTAVLFLRYVFKQQAANLCLRQWIGTRNGTGGRHVFFCEKVKNTFQLPSIIFSVNVKYEELKIFQFRDFQCYANIFSHDLMPDICHLTSERR